LSYTTKYLSPKHKHHGAKVIHCAVDSAVCHFHILLADKSESGWFTVEEYKKHDLPENSDKKRIFSAKRRARSTLSTMKKKRTSSFTTSRRALLARPSAPSTSVANTQLQPSAIQPLVPSSLTVQRPNMGSCFACGKLYLSGDGQTAASLSFKVTTRSGQTRCY